MQPLHYLQQRIHEYENTGIQERPLEMLQGNRVADRLPIEGKTGKKPGGDGSVCSEILAVVSGKLLFFLYDNERIVEKKRRADQGGQHQAFGGQADSCRADQAEQVERVSYYRIGPFGYQPIAFVAGDVYGRPQPAKHAGAHQHEPRELHE